MRKTITIPADGVTETFNFVGRSCIIEFSPIYTKVEQVPVIGFNSGGDQFGIYPRNILGVVEKCDEMFTQITVTGTAESAGGSLTLKTVKEKLDTFYQPIFAEGYETVPGSTGVLGMTDGAQSFNPLNILDAEGNKPTKVYLSASGGASSGGVRYSFVRNASRGDDSYLLPDGGEPKPIEGYEWIEALSFTTATAGETPNLIFTFEY